MVDIIRGASDNPISTNALIEFVENATIKEGILYIGYPIIGSMDEKSSLDAVLLSSEHGIIVFDIVEEPNLSDREKLRDELYNIMLQRLIGYKELTERRGKLKANLEVLTIAPPSWNANHSDRSVILTQEHFNEFIENNKQTDLSDEDYRRLLQAVQAITKLKQKVARKITTKNSKGDILNSLERSIANLDRRQSKAVIETADGIQRIRGLAGSGKTIVLALKVAYLHSKFPEWTIGVTFYTRSLKKQFEELITKFTIEQKNEEPNWEKIKILQAWGGSRDNGLYYEFCKVNGVEYLDYDMAKNKYKYSRNLLDKLSEKAISEAKNLKEIYDAILVDEAQDFSESFLKLCYALLKPISQHNNNKRLIYAYDELQKLNDADDNTVLRNPTDIFGNNIVFGNAKGKPQQDIILEKCYRNSAPVLVTAHALGFGIYRSNRELVTMFRDKELWIDVGYKVEEGNLEFGKNVVLKRDANTSPDFLVENMNIGELLVFKNCASYGEELKEVADEIEKNLRNDDLSHKDIVVIHPNPLKAKDALAPLRNLLYQRDIESHLAGVNTSPDEFFLEKSIAFTSIYRVKGNEAAMVYIVNADYCFDEPELIKKRNILFTAITRSKGWVRVYGSGEKMQGLIEEFNQVKAQNFKLSFKYPTEVEMERLNVLHRDLSEADKKEISDSKVEVRNLLDRIKNKRIHLSDLPKEEIEQLKQVLNNA